MPNMETPISEGDRRRAEATCKRKGLIPGLEVSFVDHGVPNRNLLPPTAIGILWTVPGFESNGYLSRGPYCRVKVHGRIQMVHPNEVTLLGLATNDLEAMTIWLDQEV